MEKVLVPKNMPKPPMLLLVPNHFQCAFRFLGMDQYLCICHLLCLTDFQHPLPCLYFKFRFLLTLVNVQLCAAYSATFQTVLFYNLLLLVTVLFSSQRQVFSCPWTMSCPFSSCLYVISSISIIWSPISLVLELAYLLNMLVIH